METINHSLDECPVASAIWERGTRLFKSNCRHIERTDITIAEWTKDIYKNKIVNKIWDLFPGFVVWEIRKTRNLNFFENKMRRVEEIWANIVAH